MFQRKRLGGFALAASFIALSVFGVTSSASASVGVEGLGPTTTTGSVRLGYVLPNPDLNTVVALAALAYMVSKDVVGALAEASSSSSDSSSSSSGGMITNPAGNPVTPATFDTAQ